MKTTTKAGKTRQANFFVCSCSRTDTNDFVRYPAGSYKFAEKMLEKVNAGHPERDNFIEEA